MTTPVKTPKRPSVARLNKAAPELLQLLVEYLHYNGEYAASLPTEQWVNRVGEAVARALGEKL